MEALTNHRLSLSLYTHAKAMPMIVVNHTCVASLELLPVSVYLLLGSPIDPASVSKDTFSSRLFF
jgi:hypothetical protein